MKRNKSEGKIKFAVRVVETLGTWCRPQTVLDSMDRRSYKTNLSKISAHLSVSVSEGKLVKMKNAEGLVLYGPVSLVEEPTQPVTPTPAPNVTKTVEKIKRPKRASVNDVPLGELLTWAGKSRDDVMSVIEDLLYDTPLIYLKEKYPGLYTAINKLV